MDKLILISVEGALLAGIVFLIKALCGKRAGVLNADSGPREITINLGETLRLTAGSGGDGECVWTSSDDAILTVEQGEIKGVASGSAVLTLSKDGLSDSVIVRVR